MGRAMARSHRQGGGPNSQFGVPWRWRSTGQQRLAGRQALASAWLARKSAWVTCRGGGSGRLAGGGAARAQLV